MKLLQISEAAKLLRCTRQHIDYLSRTGKLRVVVVPGAAGSGRSASGGRRHVYEHEVLALLRRRLED